MIESFRDDDDLEDQYKLPLIETQLAQLDAKLGELEEIDRKIQALTDDDALENIISENERYMLQQATLKAPIVVFCDTIKPEPPSVKDDSLSRASARSEYESIISTRGAQRYSKLAKLELPTFNGDIFQWRSFLDAFSSELDSNLDMPAVTKFNY